jgi:hypothetical protein
MSNIIKSQIIISDEIKELVAGIESPATSDTLIEIRNRMYSRLETRPYNQSTREHEKTIRWKRTSAEIIKDGYVYTGKACTDQMILFMALCEAFHLTTRFVKLKKYNEVHSVAEIKLEDGGTSLMFREKEVFQRKERQLKRIHIMDGNCGKKVEMLGIWDWLILIR